jgi:hypothetical protein
MRDEMQNSWAHAACENIKKSRAQNKEMNLKCREGESLILNVECTHEMDSLYTSPFEHRIWAVAICVLVIPNP